MSYHETLTSEQLAKLTEDQRNLVRLETSLCAGVSDWFAITKRLQENRAGWISFCRARNVSPFYGLHQLIGGVVPPFPGSHPVFRISRNGRPRLTKAQRIVYGVLDPERWQSPGELPRWVRFRRRTCLALVDKGYAEEINDAFRRLP